MKNLNRALSLLLLSATLFFTSCTKDQNENFQSTTKEFISAGKWSVDYYFAGSDKTLQFSNYQFVFTGNGTLTGTDGNNEFSGTWKTLRDVNRNDVLQITINSQDPGLTGLNLPWNVTAKSSLVISMKEGSDELRFKKL